MIIKDSGTNRTDTNVDTSNLDEYTGNYRRMILKIQPVQMAWLLRKGGVIMKKLVAFLTKPIIIWGLAGLGIVFLIVSAITGAWSLYLGNISSRYWLILAFACYLGSIWLLVTRILEKMESKT